MFRRSLSVLTQKASRKVEIYDVTLRDGMQGLGMALSLPDKLRVAEYLDELGFDYIEGGYPLSNPKDQEFFKEVAKLGLKTSKVAAFGMTHRKGVAPEKDEGMHALLRSLAPAVTIVGKTWDLHVETVLQCTKQQNLDMIADTIKFFIGKVDEVFYDAEHFFDGYKANPEYAIMTLRAAKDAGATRLILCDTNGGTLPSEISAHIAVLRKALGTEVKLGIHVHNDGGLAVANTLAAVEAGCHQVQGTINGIGERCGNVDLTSIIPNLKLKMGYDCLKPDTLHQMTGLSKTLYELTNTTPNDGQPFVGTAAFAHKGGMHVHAVAKIPHSYEHISPDIVGNQRRVLVSELSGHSNVEALLGKKYQGLDKKFKAGVVQRIAELENQGYQFESATASFELLVHELLNGHAPRYWQVESYRCAVSRIVDGPGLGPKDGRTSTNAIVKMSVGGTVQHHISEGDGPVHALDQVVRKAVLGYYPELANIKLTDYRVRVVNPSQSTGARVRVLGDFEVQNADGTTRTFTTIGVHENIIIASLLVIQDAFTYHLLEAGVKLPDLTPKKREDIEWKHIK